MICSYCGKGKPVTFQGECFGVAHHRDQKIFIEPDIPQQKKEQTLIHEIMHAVFWQTGLLARMKDVQGITEEEIVQALSMGLYQALNDGGMLK
jgi:hypothetical protein